MSKVAELSRSISSTLASQILVAFISLAFFAYFGRTLPKSEMAIYAFLTTLVSWIHLIGGLGLCSLAVRDVPGYMAAGHRQEASGLITSTIFYRSCLGLPLAGLLVCLAPFLSRHVFGTQAYVFQLQLVAAVAWLQSLEQTLSLMQWALQRFQIRALCNLLNNLSSRIFAVAGYIFWGIEGFILAFGIGSCLAITLHFWTLRTELTVKIVSLWKLLRRSRSYIGADMLRNLLQNLDQPIIAFFLGDSALADYFVSKRLYQFCQMALMSVTAPLGAKISEAKVEGAEVLRAYFHKTLYCVAILFIPAGFLLFAMSQQLLTVIVGAKYVGSACILSVFGITLMAQSTYLMWHEGVYRLMPGRFVILLTGVIALATFAGYLTFLPWLGPRGIPLAAAMGWVAGWLTAVYLLRPAGLSCQAGLYARALGCGLLALLIGWTGGMFGPSVFALVFTLCVAAALCGAAAVGLAPRGVRASMGRMFGGLNRRLLRRETGREKSERWDDQDGYWR